MDFTQKRKDAGLTQEQVARALNVAKNTVSQWENHKREPDIKTLLKLSELYDVSLDEMLGNEKFITYQPGAIIVPDEKKETVQQLLALPEKVFIFISGEINAYYQANQMR